jgi:hypothetical protein
MHRLTDKIDGDIFWCPRCGTLKSGETSIEQPMLIGRCRQFGQSLGPSWAQLWWTRGIAEAIDTPGRKEAIHDDKFTPGPWEWRYLKNDLGRLHEYPVALSGEGPLSDVLVASGNYDGDIFIYVGPADARLIPAALELLEACKEALEHLQFEAEEAGPLKDRLIAAIGKATGTTP